MNSRGLKKRVRARMKLTGVSYTEALREVKAEQKDFMATQGERNPVNAPIAGAATDLPGKEVSDER